MKTQHRFSKFKVLRTKPKKTKSVSLMCICYWCGACYHKIGGLAEHQKYYCSPRNIEAGDERFKHLTTN